MAICGKLYSGQDNACVTLQKGYIQEVKLINFQDVDTFDVTSEHDETESKHRVSFALKAGAEAIPFAGIGSGNSIRGWYSKTRDDNGYPMYVHHLQIIITRVTEEQKAILKNLDNGLYIGVAKLRSYESPESGGITEAIEVYGFGNGLSTDDYDYDITENGGVTVIDMISQESFEEPQIPYMYASATEGSELEDWDENFAGPST